MHMKDKSKREQHNIKRLHFLSGRNRWRPLAFIVAMSICSAGAVIITRAYNTKSPSAIEVNSKVETSPSALLSAQGIVQGKIPTTVLETHLITITPDHIQPAEMIASKGQCILLYENRSGQENLSLQLTSKNTFIHQLDMPLLRSMWAGEFNLTEGTYELRESLHPDWLCTITVR
jgi:hypothetical protein